MRNINQVTVSGNITRDPELRSTQSGMQVLGFGIAVNDSRKNQQTGEWEDVPNFVDCVMFGARAQSLSQIMRKGMKVCVAGKLRYSSWEDKSGGKRSKLEVVADDVELPPRARQEPAYDAVRQPYAPQAAVGMGQPYAGGYAPQPALYDEEIPF